MLFGKNAPVMIDTARNYQNELEVLYARRSAIDALIASLEDYDRFRESKPTSRPGQQRKSA
jgi:hypothetical protein